MQSPRATNNVTVTLFCKVAKRHTMDITVMFEFREVVTAPTCTHSYFIFMITYTWFTSQQSATV